MIVSEQKEVSGNGLVEKEVSGDDLLKITRSWFDYLLSKWYKILITAIIFGIIGIFYAWFKKPVYLADLTFAAENDAGPGIGAYAGIAAQFGIDLGGGSGSAFEGENLVHFMSSRLMQEKALLTPVTINNKRQLLVDYYIKAHEIDKGLRKNPKLRNITFENYTETRNRARDSVFKKIYQEITTTLAIGRVDKKADIISVQLEDTDELFAKLYVENLVRTVIDYYIDYRSQKSRQNVQLLQRQTDSVKGLLTGNIIDIAVTNDLNVNPLRQVTRTGVQRKQVDMQVNGALYAELAKNLEMSKITLRREMPFIQLIDLPVLPLEKRKMGRLKGAVLFGIMGAFLAIGYFVMRKLAVK